MWSDDLDRRKLKPGSQQQWRERMREAESKSWEKEVEQEWEREMVKILEIWAFLFELSCDCFVINFLDWIWSLSCWILVYLKDNDVIFGTIDFV